MIEEQIRKQLLALDCPHLCRLTVTAEVHPRCVALCHDGKEYAVTLHEMLSKRAWIYGTASKKSRNDGLRCAKHQELW